MMYLSVIAVKPMKDHRLELTFENGERKIFDITPYLDKGIFKKLKNENLFKQVKVSFDTIEWPGEIDIDPETLYEDGLPIGVELIEKGYGERVLR
jgi:hypothetical protein